MKNVPKGWRIKLLDAIAKRGTGHTPSKRKPSYWGGDIRWVSLGDTTRLDRVWIDDSADSITKEGLDNSSTFLHPPGTVVLLRGSSVGKSAILRREMTVSQDYVTWTCGPELHNIYLYQWLQRMKPAFQRVSNGSTVKTIGLPFFEKLEIAFPSICEQRVIAEILLCWDGSIQKQDALVAAKEQFKRGLMQQLLTGQRRFKEFVKSDKKVKSRYGDFPADWSQVHMGDIAEEIGAKNDGGHHLPVLSCTKRRGLVNSLEYFGKRVFSEDTSNYKVVRRGDFAYATNHIEEGSIGYQNLHDAALISPMYTVFRTRAGVDHTFFFKLIKTELYRHIFEVNTSGSIARRGGLRWDEFALIKVFLPGVPEQKRTAAVLSACDREIELLQKQLETVKEQKRGLMQKLLTGEIRVKITKAH